MKRHGRPETIVMDRLRSYGAALKDLGRGDDREVGCWLYNRAENSHLPFRRRERAMLRFRRMRTLQKFASVHASVHNHFSTEGLPQDRDTDKKVRADALADWRGPNEPWGRGNGDWFPFVGQHAMKASMVQHVRLKLEARGIRFLENGQVATGPGAAMNGEAHG
jgi:DDE domain